jgi:hypothetical protein
MKRRFLHLLLLSALSLPSIAAAQPEIVSATLRYGLAVRVPRHSWAYLNFTLQNPLSEAADVRLVFSPEGQRNFTAYEHRATLQPGQTYSSRMLVAIGSVETYKARLFYKNNEVDTEEMLNRFTLHHHRTLMFMNDDPDIGYGVFHDNYNLDVRYVKAHLPAAKAPGHWAGYDRVQAVIIVRPNLDSLTPRQVGALRDYTARGGTLLFCHPAGIVEAAASPLAELLPGKPVTVRNEARIDAFKTIGGTPLSVTGGIEFLEFEAADDGVTTLYHGDLPMVRWRRYGLGRVGISAVYPSHAAIKGTENFNVLYKHVLAHSGRIDYVSSEGNRDVSEALNSLTGIRIPDAAEVRGLIIPYLCILTVLLTLTLAGKQPLKIWGAVAVYAVGMTVYVFHYAGSRMSEISDHAAATIEFNSRANAAPTSERVVSIVSKQSQAISLAGTTSEVNIRALLPPPVVFDKKTGEQEADPDERHSDALNVLSRDDGKAIEQLTLRPMAPRSHSELTRARALEIGDGPMVEWSIDGPTMTAWTLPEELASAMHVAMLCEGGAIPMMIENGVCRLAHDVSDIRSLSPELAALTRRMVTMRMPAPLIAVFSAIDSDDVGTIPKHFTVAGRRLEWLPITQKLSGPLAIPSQRMFLDTQNNNAQFLQFDTAGEPTKQRESEKYYDIDVYPPGEFAAMSIKTIKVVFVADNRGKNLKFGISLRPPVSNADKDLPLPGIGLKELSKEAARDIAPSRVDGNVYYFDNVQETDAVAASNRKFTVVIRSTAIKQIDDQVAFGRVNSWVVARFEVSAIGELPERYGGEL